MQSLAPTAAEPTPRAYNTDYAAHQGLLHTFARKAYGRLCAANVYIDYEDVFGQMSVTYCKALAKFDGDRGVGFTAYLGRAVWNEFNRYAEKVIGEQVELRLTRIDAFQNGSEGGSLDAYESLASEAATPEQALERKQDIVNNLRALSPVAKFLAAQLLNPSKELLAGFDHYQQQMEIEKAEGRAIRKMGAITLSFIGRHYQLKPSQVSAAKAELTRVYGVRV